VFVNKKKTISETKFKKFTPGLRNFVVKPRNSWRI